MKEKIENYVRTLGVIAVSKGGDDFTPTIPGLNYRRMQLHEELFDELLKRLDLVDGFTPDEAMERSKELFSRLDKVFRLYNDFDLDLSDPDHLDILSGDLEKFLGKTEVRYFLEGRTKGVHGVVSLD